MNKQLFLTILLTSLYTGVMIACGCAPLSFGKLTMKEFNDYDVVVKAIVLDASGPALTEKTTEKKSEKHYHVDSYGYHSVEDAPKESSAINLKVTKTIKGKVDRNIPLTIKNAEKYGYYCSYNKVVPGKSYYFFLNKNGDAFEMLYTSRMVALTTSYDSFTHLEEMKKRSATNQLEELEQKQLDHKIKQLEASLKSEREIKAQNLSFINKIRTNTSSKWYSTDKKLEAVGNLENGVPVGTWEYYGYDGEFVEEMGAFKKGKRHGEWNRYFNKTEIVLSTYNYKNGTLDGKYSNYFNDGKIQNEAIYKNGMKEGLTKNYHRNGELSLVANYKNDKLNGKRIGYLQNGELSLKENYEAGKREGVFIRYFQSGILKDVVTYENDLPVGKYYRYFEDGSTKLDGQYNVKGIRTGEWKYYNRDGSIRTVELLDENGNLAMGERN